MHFSIDAWDLNLFKLVRVSMYVLLGDGVHVITCSHQK